LRSQFASVSQSTWQHLGSRYLAALHSEMFRISPSLKENKNFVSADEFKVSDVDFGHQQVNDLSESHVCCSRLHADPLHTQNRVKTAVDYFPQSSPQASAICQVLS
jgi:hypothetical protein